MKILMAQFPLEVHSRGMIAVSSILRDMGYEVIVLGNAPLRAIAQAAADEGVDVIGISAYCGGEIEQGTMLSRMTDKKLMIGGCIPDDNAGRLCTMGYEVCTPENTIQDIMELFNDAG